MTSGTPLIGSPLGLQFSTSPRTRERNLSGGSPGMGALAGFGASMSGERKGSPISQTLVYGPSGPAVPTSPISPQQQFSVPQLPSSGIYEQPRSSSFSPLTPQQTWAIQANEEAETKQLDQAQRYRQYRMQRLAQDAANTNLLLVLQRRTGPWTLDMNPSKWNIDEFKTWNNSIQWIGAPVTMFYVKRGTFSAGDWERLQRGITEDYSFTRIKLGNEIYFNRVYASSTGMGYSDSGESNILQSIISGKSGMRLEIPAGSMGGNTWVVGVNEILPKMGAGESPRSSPASKPSVLPITSGVSPLSYRPQGSYYLSSFE